MFVLGRQKEMKKYFPLDTLRDCISGALASYVKAYNLPEVCTKLGLEQGEGAEAHRSKRIYVKNRLLSFTEAELLRIALGVLKEFDDEVLADMVSEMTEHSTNRITDITRREVLKAVNGLDPLFGDFDLWKGLDIVALSPLSPEVDGDPWGIIPRLIEEIKQHYIRNDDYSNEDLLKKCDALTCSQKRFFTLIEKLLDPVVRRGEEQDQLAKALNTILKVDGFHLVVNGEQSKHPIYSVQRITSGVTGIPKNLIFASINTKPDIYFTDAINNDIAIRNDTDALIYDRHLTSSGLLWSTMAEWWQEREKLNDLQIARDSLGKRLKESVESANSPGEYALFSTYYREFKSRQGDQLPALIPQVYLHYDPKTVKQRGNDPVLLRQRMDLLMLLDHNVRIVIEVDGKHHYADGEKASPSKYADMVAEDRQLRLAGYELYRFGGSEFEDSRLENGKYTIGEVSKKVATDFFLKLFEKHNITANA